ncbi:MAG: exopolysaccharide biosynthesis polyprenyl glycosylphosphotransferase [Parvularculaceae bacterium]|nr:exopolysaccharide biosynthesis polyprenyl glycosylphosphotransferase [Parvularculaceae bacterium]
MNAAVAMAAFACAAGLMLVIAPRFVRRIGRTLLIASAVPGLGAKGTPFGRVDPAVFSEPDLERANALRTPGLSRASKRAFDVIAAALLIVFFSWLLLLTAILIRLDSPGPALYRQRRVGKDGKVFEIFKFRSMRADAEKNGAQWASSGDDRITRIGRFIRRTRIDEIPQAFNILKGEMSFVGPRPERPEFVAQLEREIPHYHDRHLVKPGITGWAQVRHEYTASVEGARDKLCYDLFYVKHFSLLLDLLIVLMTVRVAVLGIGSR